MAALIVLASEAVGVTSAARIGTLVRSGHQLPGVFLVDCFGVPDAVFPTSQDFNASTSHRHGAQQQKPDSFESGFDVTARTRLKLLLGLF